MCPAEQLRESALDTAAPTEQWEHKEKRVMREEERQGEEGIVTDILRHRS